MKPGRTGRARRQRRERKSRRSRPRGGTCAPPRTGRRTPGVRSRAHWWGSVGWSRRSFTRMRRRRHRLPESGGPRAAHLSKSNRQIGRTSVFAHANSYKFPFCSRPLNHRQSCHAPTKFLAPSSPTTSRLQSERVTRGLRFDMAPQQGMDPQMASFLEEEKRKAMFNEVRRIPIASISTRLPMDFQTLTMRLLTVPTETPTRTKRRWSRSSRTCASISAYPSRARAWTGTRARACRSAPSGTSKQAR